MNQTIGLALIAVGLTMIGYALPDSYAAVTGRLAGHAPVMHFIWLPVAGLLVTLCGAATILRRPNKL